MYQGGTETELAERLRNERERRGLTQKVVAQALGVQRSTYSRWEKGNREPDIETLHKLANFFETSVAYLLGEATEEIAKNISSNCETFPVPIFASISAGSFSIMQEQIEGWTAITQEEAAGGQYFALRVKDECMKASRLQTGDIVIVRRQLTVKDGQIAVVLWPGIQEAQLRRVYRRNAFALLVADDPECPPEIIRKKQVEVFGLVVGFHGKLPFNERSTVYRKQLELSQNLL